MVTQVRSLTRGPRSLVRYVSARMPRGRRLLAFGARDWAWLFPLAGRLGAIVAVVDTAEAVAAGEAQRQALGIENILFTQASGASLSRRFAAASFDLALAWAEPPEMTLVYRLLAPGGVLVIELEGESSLFSLRQISGQMSEQQRLFEGTRAATVARDARDAGFAEVRVMRRAQPMTVVDRASLDRLIESLGSDAAPSPTGLVRVYRRLEAGGALRTEAVRYVISARKLRLAAANGPRPGGEHSRQT